MTNRRFAVPIFVASLWFAACGSDPPPPPADPTPVAQQPAPDPGPDTAAERRAREEAEAAARRARVAAARASLEAVIYFDYDRSEITPQSQNVLRDKADILRASPAVRLRIEGHADERGSTEYNLALGTRRAESVREFFVGFGLNGDRFTLQSYGEERPAAQGSNETAWARNRRAEFVITAGANQINPAMDDRDGS